MNALPQSSMNTSLGAVSARLVGSHVIGDSAVRVERVHMDSRSVQTGDLFLALCGERFDAHTFLADVAKVSGVSVLINQSFESTARALGLNAVCVQDTKAALAALATAWRAEHRVPLIGVAGSNGKTTVTQMIASILRAHAGEHALATQGNLNNDIGVPQTILRLRAHHRCAVVELGMNHPGEIAHLAHIAQPSVALVNNAQREHQEFMSSVRAVAIENGQVLSHLASDGVAVFPHGDTYTGLWIELSAGRRYLTFSDQTPHNSAQEQKSNQQQITVSRAPDVQLLSAHAAHGVWTLRVQTPTGLLTTELSVAGQHNIRNALAATACCLAIGLHLSVIDAGLRAFRALSGRSRALTLLLRAPRSDEGRCDPVTLVDDTYNANPDSVIAAIDVLAQMPAPSLLILGDMGEVGEEGPNYHKEMGVYAANAAVSALFTLGELAQHTTASYSAATKHMSNAPGGSAFKSEHFNSMHALIERAQECAPHYKSILIKGSRFMKMEMCVQALELQGSASKDNDKNVQITAQTKESKCC